jgi:phosphoglycerol transferase MdoB-like AlkP superfamily enzyme
MKLNIPASIKYLFSVYVAGIVFFTIFRLVLIYSNFQQIPEIPNKASIMLQAMLMGWRFDTVISGYILALPFFVLVVAELGFYIGRGLLTAIHIFLSIVYSIVFFGCAADIPFFQTYNERLNITILNWTSSPMFMVKMVIEEWHYLSYFFLFLLITIVFCFVLHRIYKRYLPRLVSKKRERKFSYKKLIVSILAAGLLFLGIRGRIEEKSPIVVGTAYFSSYNFPNKIGLNPLFSFMNSWLDTYKEENKQLHLMDDREALSLVQSYLHINPVDTANPIARNVQFSEPAEKHNVVVILMESMSANFLSRFGNKLNLTPRLDALANKGYSFDHFYSAGVHTFNGIFSVLYSFPALLARHTMTDAIIPQYSGLPYIMKSNGYKTVFFTTHDEQFDNEGGFVTANNMDSVIGLKDYPASAKLSTLGVPDHFMFDFAIPVFNKYHQQKQPFFSVMVTTSNHGPYIIPKGIPFKPKHTEVRDGVVEYADWAIGHFIDSASKLPWFDNTIFVFVADHGTYEGDYIGDMGYSLNHIPCIIYSPLLKDAPKVINKPGGQIDIGPTIAGLLHLPYVNNTMGIDLFKDTRPYMYFSADDKLAVADDTDIYIWHKDGRESMHPFSNTANNILALKKAKAGGMKQYAFSMVQTTQWLLLNHKTGPVAVTK